MYYLHLSQGVISSRSAYLFTHNHTYRLFTKLLLFMFACRSLVTYCLVLSAVVLVLLVQLSCIVSRCICLVLSDIVVVLLVQMSCIVFLSKSFVTYTYINHLCNFTFVCSYHVTPLCTCPFVNCP